MLKSTLKKYLGDRLTDEQMNQAIALINGKVDPSKYTSVQDLLGRCCNKPSNIERIMCALNEVLEGYGVEGLEREYVDRYHQNIQATYINFGDPYIPTIIFDDVKRKFLVACYGDFIERNPKRFPQYKE